VNHALDKHDYILLKSNPFAKNLLIKSYHAIWSGSPTALISTSLAIIEAVSGSIDSFEGDDAVLVGSKLSLQL
jgi:hypothetical protein